jgi:two-component system chemotaxis response regulator CheB
MIVEDSDTDRELLIYSFAAESDIEVVGVAKDGEEAIAMVERVKPNIILMDINMPHLNGYEASKRIMEENPTPILLMSATWDIKEVAKILESMHIGVLGVYEKPYGPGHPKYKELYDKIVADIRVMSDVKVIRRFNHKHFESGFKTLQEKECIKECKFVLIGSSTGGPPVLHSILKALPADYSLPILVAQHMSREFIDTFISWLNEQCALYVKKAEECEKISAGVVYIAPANYHLTLQNNRIRLLEADKSELFVPSVSKLFSSVTQWNAGEAVAILLSGMGDDGAEAITKLKQGGAVTMAQNEESSVVFGMANEAIKKGGIEYILSPQGITEFLLNIKIEKKGI